MIRRSSVLAHLVCPPDRLLCISEGWPWTNPPCSSRVPGLWESSTVPSLCGSRKQIQGFLQALENRAPYSVPLSQFLQTLSFTVCLPSVLHLKLGTNILFTSRKNTRSTSILGSPGPTLYLVSCWVKHPQHSSPIWLQLNSSTAFFTLVGGSSRQGFPVSLESFLELAL